MLTLCAPVCVCVAQVAPTVVVYKAAVVACGKAGEWEAALDVLGRLERAVSQRGQLRAESYIGAMDAVAAASRLTEGFEADPHQRRQSTPTHRARPFTQWQRALILCAVLMRYTGSSCSSAPGVRTSLGRSPIGKPSTWSTGSHMVCTPTPCTFPCRCTGLLQVC